MSNVTRSTAFTTWYSRTKRFWMPPHTPSRRRKVRKSLDRSLTVMRGGSGMRRESLTRRMAEGGQRQESQKASKRHTERAGNPCVHNSLPRSLGAEEDVFPLKEFDRGEKRQSRIDAGGCEND